MGNGRKPQTEGFWDRPPLMNLVADLLFLAAGAALAYSAALVLVRLPLFPLREVVVTVPLREVTAAQIEYAARSSLSGNFFTVNLDGVRAALEKLPWVRRAEVRRRWPDGLEVALEEQVAAARWRQAEGAEARLVNVHGEVFAAASNADLPVFAGPEGSADQVMARYQEFSALFAPLGRKPRTVVLNAREAWQIRLDDGVVLDLGRDQPKAPLAQRVARFVAVYGEALKKLNSPADVVDLRYPNGFAIRPGRSGQEQKGKQ